jgi:hypothetical protein
MFIFIFDVWRDGHSGRQKPKEVEEKVYISDSYTLLFIFTLIQQCLIMYILTIDNRQADCYSMLRIKLWVIYYCMFLLNYLDK